MLALPSVWQCQRTRRHRAECKCRKLFLVQASFEVLSEKVWDSGLRIQSLGFRVSQTLLCGARLRFGALDELYRIEGS